MGRWTDTMGYFFFVFREQRDICAAAYVFECVQLQPVAIGSIVSVNSNGEKESEKMGDDGVQIQ